MAWPSTLVRTKDWGTEVLTDADLEGQFDLIITYINDMMDETSGHKHDGTAAEGPLINLDGINIGVTGELQETDGGTGLSAYTTGDILYASASNTLSVLAAGTTGEVLKQGASIPEWGLPGDLSITSQAQGDVLYFDGTNWVRLAAGTSGQFLKTQGSGANPTWGDGGGPYTDGTTYAEATASTERSASPGGSYTKLKELSPLWRSGTVTVTWESKGDNASNHKTRLYINDVAQGSEHNDTRNTYGTETESAVSVSIGDVIQVYGDNDQANTVFVQNLKVNCLNPTTVQEVSGL